MPGGDGLRVRLTTNGRSSRKRVDAYRTTELGDLSGAPSIAFRSIGVMKLMRNVIVFDAADRSAESAFWAGILGGHVIEDEAWHSVIDAAGSGGSGCSWHRTTSLLTGRTETLSKCTSTSTSMTHELHMKRQSPLAPDCFNQLLI